MTPEAWLEVLQPGVIPIFRRTHEALAELEPKRDRISAREVAKEILADPLASFQALHAINKRVGPRHGTEVVTVEHALMMQGIGVFLDGARDWPMVENSLPQQDQRVPHALYALTRRAQHAAWQARDFAVLHTDTRAEELQVAALLQAIPEFLLWLRAPDAALQLKRLRTRMSDEAAETEALGMPLEALRKQLLETWNIPATLLDLLDKAQADKPRQTILNACCEIARRSERGWWDEGLPEQYAAIAAIENTPMEDVIATVHMNAARVARAGNWLPAPAAATWGPMLPGEWPVDAEDIETMPAADADTGSSGIAAPQPVPVAASHPAPPTPQAPSPSIDVPTLAMPAAVPTPPPEVEPEPAVCPMPDKRVLRETLKGIESHLDGTLSLNQMSAIILKGLHTGLGLTRILFAMVTPDGTKVKSRFTLGIPVGDPLRQFEFELGSKDLFNQLMGKMQGVWVNADNREKLWPMVNPDLQAKIGAGDFYAMSLFQGTRAVGLIYADRGHGQCGLDPLTYTDFKMLCLQAARGLAKIKQ